MPHANDEKLYSLGNGYLATVTTRPVVYIWHKENQIVNTYGSPFQADDLEHAKSVVRGLIESNKGANNG